MFVSRILYVGRYAVAAFSISVCLFQTQAVAQDRPTQPNFIIVLADDLGWQDLKCYDIDTPSVFETPYIDALSSEGVLFWQGYSPAPTCAPSRGAIMAGKRPARLQRTHVAGGTCPKPYNSDQRMIVPYYKGRLEVAEVTIPEALAPLGYFSGHSGKWHIAISHNTYPQPEDHGFDWSESDRGVTNGMSDRNTGFATSDPSDPYQLDANGFAFDLTTQNALNFMTEAVTGVDTADQPFFLYYASWLVHTPIHMRTESLLIKYAAKMGYDYPLDGSEFFAAGQNNPYYAAMVETFDYNVHQIVDYLENTDDPRWSGHKLIENTYVFITSDNGGMERSGEYITDNYPLDEGKIRSEEGGTRVPFIILGPDITANQESDVMINGLDLYPTILSMAGGTLSATLDGCDLSDLLRTDPTDPLLVKDSSGAVRDTMYWHFPETGKFNSTIRKDGWKLFQNYDHVDNSGTNTYRLYELYDSAGVRQDIEEASDVIDTDTSGIAATLTAELNAWLTEVDAGMPSYNPNYSGTLSNKELVPAVLDKGDVGEVAWVTYETDKAQVVRADLIYTLNGGATYEEWFKASATIVSSGRAEAVIPEGTTHYLFNLIDENDFLVSTEDLGYENDGLKDSTFVPAYFASGTRAALYQNGFSSGSVNAMGALRRNSSGVAVGTSSAWEVSGGKLSNSSLTNSKVSEGAAAVLIDLTNFNDLALDEFTVSFDYSAIEAGERIYVHVWGYQDVSSTETTNLMNLNASNGNAWESSGAAMNAYNLGKADGVFTGTAGIASDAASILTGAVGPQTYVRTFSVADFSAARDTLAEYDYLVVGITRYFSGSAPAVSIDDLAISVVSSGGTILLEDDFSTSQLDASGGVVFGDRGDGLWHAINSSEWQVQGGALTNDGGGSAGNDEGALTQLIDLRGIGDDSLNTLGVEFDFEANSSSESLYVHLWGLNYSSDPSLSSSLVNQGATNGNAWAATAALSADGFYNLGQFDGVFTGTAGIASDAAIVLNPLGTVPQKLQASVNLSENVLSSSVLTDYDYLLIAFARNEAGTSPSIIIDNLSISAFEGFSFSSNTDAVLVEEDFEGGLGVFVSGGADAELSTVNPSSGVNSVRLRDNNGVASSIYMDNGVDVNGYSELEVSFDFTPASMESGEDFWLQYYDGSTWQTISAYVSGINMENNQSYSSTKLITLKDYVFPTNMKLRFMCDASGSGDYVYIDNLKIIGR